MASCAVGITATCPHCGVDVQFVPAVVEDAQAGHQGRIDYVFYRVSDVVEGAPDRLQVRASRCPRAECGRLVVEIQYTKKTFGKWQEAEAYLVYPRKSSRKPVSPQVPNALRADYEEACLVLPYSAKASAALSRRCLQALLQEKGFSEHDLNGQIDKALPSLPGDLAGMLDAVRTIGNFAAHSIKSKSSGEIIEVEPGEAEWSVEVLEALFEHYYERPSRITAKKEALNRKLQDAGKPPLKTT